MMKKIILILQFNLLKTNYILSCGHIRYNTDEPITQEMINKVQDKINKTDMSQCYSNEIYSVMEHNRRFDNFNIISKL